VRSCSDPRYFTELDALALDDEEEGPSYLADLNKAPDFVDEVPVEAAEVRISNFSPILAVLTSSTATSNNSRSRQNHIVLSSLLPVFYFQRAYDQASM